LTKILSKSGDSLADTYDVVGSIAGIDELESREVNLIHEMGGTIFSERYGGSIRRVSTGNIAQSTPFEATIAGLTSNSKVEAITVLVDTVARTLFANVSLQSLTVGTRGIPIWNWDETNEDTIRFFDVTLANKNVLRPFPEYTRLPVYIQGTNQDEGVQSIVLRGTSATFGAGTVDITLLAFVSFAQTGGVSSRGLPLPSW